MRRILAGMVLVCLLSVSIGSAAAAAETNAVTATSVLKDLDPHNNYRMQTATLLAFVASEDDRPWYVDDALLVLQLPKDKLVLVHAVRNPKYPPGHKGGSTAWGLHHVMDAPHVGDRYFDQRPTRQEVDQFLKDNQWKSESDKSWRVVSRVVNEQDWLRVLGYKPRVQDRR